MEHRKSVEHAALAVEEPDAERLDLRRHLELFELGAAAETLLLRHVDVGREPGHVDPADIAVLEHAVKVVLGVAVDFARGLRGAEDDVEARSGPARTVEHVGAERFQRVRKDDFAREVGREPEDGGAEGLEARRRPEVDRRDGRGLERGLVDCVERGAENHAESGSGRAGALEGGGTERREGVRKRDCAREVRDVLERRLPDRREGRGVGEGDKRRQIRVVLRRLVFDGRERGRPREVERPDARVAQGGRNERGLAGAENEIEAGALADAGAGERLGGERDQGVRNRDDSGEVRHVLKSRGGETREDGVLEPRHGRKTRCVLIRIILDGRERGRRREIDVGDAGVAERACLDFREAGAEHKVKPGSRDAVGAERVLAD